VEALKIVSRIKGSIEVLTYPSEMGENECREAGLLPKVIGLIRDGETAPEDTQRAAQQMVAAGVDLILYAGGDGTARDICYAIGEKVATLGIPAGVKIHSAVFAVTPRSAGEVAVMCFEGRLINFREAEVMDIDEDAFRRGVVKAKLYGYLKVPEESRHVQNLKAGEIQSEQESLQGMAAEIINVMDDDSCYFIIGPGTTTKVIMENLGLEKTLLGADILCNKQLVGADVSEQQIMEKIRGNRAKIVITPIGGQGHIFGRGNQQLSPQVIRMVGKENIIVVATKEKLSSLSGRPLLVDTGDEELNEDLSGYIKVTTGFADYVMYKVGY
jgi:predicted polyphosphate/ATP-dependent NAD kinase